MPTTRLPVLFLTDLVVLPGMVVPVELDDAARAAVDAASSHSEGRLLVAPRLEDRYASYGVEASIVQIGRLSNGEPAAVLRAEHRVRIGSGVSGPGPALWVEAHEVSSGSSGDHDEVARLAAEYKALVIATLQRRDAWQVIDTVNKVTDPSTLADLAGYASWLTDAQKRQLLETPDVAERLRVLVEWAKDYLAETEVNDKIADDVREGMEKTQREFLLRQQLAAIRKELGEDEPDGAQDYRARVEQADLPDDVRKAALREVAKLERASDQSPETGYLRTWLDTVLELPWGTRTTDTTDVDAARDILDADHHGLGDVKDRIVEYLAVRSRRAERHLEVVGGRGSGAVMALVGPPGVGKTSLGESVARALGRKFVRVALGGVRDEAEIRGHRRTYVGALPGRIVRALTEAGSMNPVVLLDEIDKVGADYRGDPAAALLEVLDPAQNHTFRDHYLEVDLDLSDVVFLATANVVETIPQALLDRMELVQLDGYTEDDKVAIAGAYLLPRQLSLAALTEDEVRVDDDALREIAANYTREPGVRQLERLLAKALRKAATRLAKADGPQQLVIDASTLRGYLGRPRFTPDAHERTAVPGVATGLAVTGLGGDVLFVEASGGPSTGSGNGGTGSDPSTGSGNGPTGSGNGGRGSDPSTGSGNGPTGSGNGGTGSGPSTGSGNGTLTLTGQLGEVMKESAQIALSYVRAHAHELGITDTAALYGPIHVHVPAGAVPKDGPSAGVTMVTALTSMALGRPVRGEVGMTGEVTLNGRVLPIGGLKQKLLAAQRAGLTTVFVPKRNEPDLDEVPEDVLAAIDVRPMTDVAELVGQAIEPSGQTAGGVAGSARLAAP